jgi:hypothetical protein
MTTWYEESGHAYMTKPEKLEALYNALKGAVRSLDLKAPTRVELVRYIKAQDENELFQKAIKDELGDGFFDYVDDAGTPHVGLLSFYGQLSGDEKKEFRKYNREHYDLVQDYYDMRDDFEESHPTWAEFYGYEAEPTVSLPYQPVTESILTPPNPQITTPQVEGAVPRKAKSEEDDEEDVVTAPPPIPMPTGGLSGTTVPPTKPEYIPAFKMDSRLDGGKVSTGLLNIVGDKMAWEIDGIASGRKLSSSGISFLRSVASRYPQYQSEINSILARGT